jgi:hypothetical protein
MRKYGFRDKLQSIRTSDDQGTLRSDAITAQMLLQSVHWSEVIRRIHGLCLNNQPGSSIYVTDHMKHIYAN